MSTTEILPIMSLSLTSDEGVSLITVEDREFQGYEVCRDGEVMSISTRAFSPAVFSHAERAVEFALESAGWRVSSKTPAFPTT